MLGNSTIDSIRIILRHRGRPDLAELLQHSIAHIDESSTYGSYYCSRLSTLEIHSPLKNHERLKRLSDQDKSEIFDATLEIYPPKAYEVEITDLNFYLDLSLEPEHSISCTELKHLGFDFINEQIQKCEDKIRDGDFDGAITNARTLVESICLFILEENNQSTDFGGNLIKTYKEVIKLLNMDPSKHEEESFKQILSGFISIINGLASLRNSMSDAHGKSKTKRYKPEKRHAVMAVNAAKVISEYIYESWKSKNDG